MFNKLLYALIVAVVTFVSCQIVADDTELYLVDSNVRTGKRPQVLFIFDNSGSMSTEDENAVSSYCSEADHAAGRCQYPDGFESYLSSYSGYINQKGTYWNAGGIDNTSNMPTPDDPNDGRRFYKDNNNCYSSIAVLAEKGRYTGYLGEFKRNRWNPLANNNGFNKNDIVDCYEDIIGSHPENPGLNRTGYPINNSQMYTSNRSSSQQSTYNSWGSPVTLYTAHYLVWYKWATTTDEGRASGGTGTRLEVAKSALTSALQTLNIPIDAALAVYNLNWPEENYADGGRIVYGMNEMTDSNKSALISLINGMPAQTNTPLCETLFEAYQFFSGGQVIFGNDDKNARSPNRIDDYQPNTPPSILDSGSYESPFKTCPDTAYVIYITDGAPTLDHAADGLIATLTSAAKEPADYSPFTYVSGNSDTETDTTYLPALAAYMYNNDIVVGPKDANGIDNKQNVRLFTIGFSDGADKAASVLEEAAFRGGNPREGNVSKGYYVAKTGLDLVEAMSDALKSILSIDSSFTSPSIASNNFDKTETYNSAYFAMFLPGTGPRWSGNLKKLKVSPSGEIVGPGGVSGVIDTNGNISNSTCTYWNSCQAGNVDGNKVNSGGVLPALRTALKGRTIYTDASERLVELTSLADSSLNSLLGSPALNDGDTIQNYRDWLYGVDVDDEDNDGSKTDAREDIMGDPLHSKPLAINFGNKPETDSTGGITENLDVRILVGTNQGVVHMFKDSDAGSSDYSVGTVVESWAFAPAELLHNIPVLRQDESTGTHSVYGMDLSPVAYTETDANGKVNKAWVFLGMRRGGTSYYALNITNPDAPAYKWKIGSDDADFAELGQTWSEPVVTFIAGRENPVLIFGGGMDSGNATGAAIFVVDAYTGAFINKFTHASMDSVPNKVAILDSNNDGYTDRIYATDVSGSVWRMDLPSASSSSWSVFQFASISSSASAASNRHFFAEPTVAQTQINNIHSENGVLTSQTIPYDAVTVGTGNRPHPLDTQTQDMFFVFQDRNVVSQTFDSSNTPATLTIDDLYDVTDAPPSSQTDDIAFSGKRGWYKDFETLGEKSLSSSLIFDGKVYFTSFVPPVNQQVDLDAGICGFSGEGRLYVYDLHKGTRSYSEAYYEIGQRVPDTPQIVIPRPENGEDPKAYVIGVGKGECDNGTCTGTIELGGGLKTNRIYYHVDE